MIVESVAGYRIRRHARHKVSGLCVYASGAHAERQPVFLR